MNKCLHAILVLCDQVKGALIIFSRTEKPKNLIEFYKNLNVILNYIVCHFKFMVCIFVKTILDNVMRLTTYLIRKFREYTD